MSPCLVLMVAVFMGVPVVCCSWSVVCNFEVIQNTTDNGQMTTELAKKYTYRATERMTLPRKLARRLWAAHSNFQEHEGTLSAAGIAYYVALSFFPLLLVLVASLSSILQWTEIGQNARVELRNVIAQQASPDLAQQVDRSLRAVCDRASATGPIGFLVLIISAIAIFAQLDAAFDRIWRLPPDPHMS